MPRTTIPVAQSLYRAMHGGGADSHAQTVSQHLAQIADAPDRDRQAVGLWTGFQRLAEKRQGRGIELRGAARPRLVGQAVPAAGQEPRAPRPHPVRRGREQTGHRKNGMPFAQQEQRMSPAADARIGISPTSNDAAPPAAHDRSPDMAVPSLRDCSLYPGPLLLSIRLGAQAPYWDRRNIRDPKRRGEDVSAITCRARRRRRPWPIWVRRGPSTSSLPSRLNRAGVVSTSFAAAAHPGVPLLHPIGSETRSRAASPPISFRPDPSELCRGRRALTRERSRPRLG